jgi:type I restriction enzyme, S subunit
MIPTHWKREHIVNVCEYAVDCVNRTAPTVEEITLYLMIRTSNIRDGRISLNAVKHVTEEVYLNWTRRLVPQRGDVILTREAPVGEVGMIEGNEKIFLGQRLFHYRTNKEIMSPEYLLYALLSPMTQRHIKEMSFGATVEHIKVEDALRIPITFPPLPEQTAIASLLSTWDQVIEKTERLIIAKEKRYLWLLSSVISNSKYHHGHIRDFASEVSKRNSGAAIERVLSVTNRNGFVLPEDQFERRVASSDLSNYKIVTSGQYAYNPSRINVGSIARLDGWDSGVLSPMYVVFKINEKKVNSDFFLHWLESHEAKERIRKSAQGSVRETVSFADLGAIPFPLPILEKQQVVAETLNTARQEIDLLKKQAQAYRKQKRGLMQKLLTGEWRVRTGKEAA